MIFKSILLENIFLKIISVFDIVLGDKGIIMN